MHTIKKNLLQDLLSHKEPVVPQFVELIENYQNFYDRSNLMGHITSSSFVVNPQRDKMLLVKHKKLHSWLQPGGHIDSVISPFDNAVKELQEECYNNCPIEYKALEDKMMFDLDIHGVGDHKHYDIGYLFEIDETAPIHCSAESEDVAWVRIEDILKSEEYDNIRVQRVAQKIIALEHQNSLTKFKC